MIEQMMRFGLMFMLIWMFTTSRNKASANMTMTHRKLLLLYAQGLSRGHLLC